jgi:hypothetical protein
MDNPCIEMGVPINHPFIDGLSIINRLFWGTPIYENPAQNMENPSVVDDFPSKKHWFAKLSASSKNPGSYIQKGGAKPRESATSCREASGCPDLPDGGRTMAQKMMQRV